MPPNLYRCPCGKDLTYHNSYRCRICKDYFCDQCSLDHFGLIEEGEKVRYKNIFKTIFWFIKKRLFGK